ncbi:hypothetical protein AVEN_113987-1 [Araneus ventricosus]|uniref:Uncharacterized protein n=1 Tax=Araneus ventricosus TaxID=182803 RepID=A0A4Y2K187_ARAVE|nr:hypothetical protein AVEN_113987-1 [Araneus ventricosus]
MYPRIAPLPPSQLFIVFNFNTVRERKNGLKNTSFLSLLLLLPNFISIVCLFSDIFSLRKDSPSRNRQCCQNRFYVNRLQWSLIVERRKRPAAGLLVSSYFAPTDNREGAEETYDSETDLSSGVHQQPERPTAWLQRSQVCGYSHQRATKQNSNSKKRWQTCLSALY